MDYAPQQGGKIGKMKSPNEEKKTSKSKSIIIKGGNYSLSIARDVVIVPDNIVPSTMPSPFAAPHKNGSTLETLRGVSFIVTSLYSSNL